MKKQFQLTTEFINLSQLLKATKIVSSGSEAHFLISNKQVKVNGKIDLRKRTKLYKGDMVQIGKTIIEIE